MPAVRDLLARKGAAVTTIAPDATVLDAARLMNDRGIGGLVVVADGRIAGVFTERDILRRIVAAQRDPAATRVRDVMTTDVITCSPDTRLEECGLVMTQRRIRHLPVVGDGGVAGMVTIGDLLAHEVVESRETIDHLQSYVFDTRPV